MSLFLLKYMVVPLLRGFARTMQQRWLSKPDSQPKEKSENVSSVCGALRQQRQQVLDHAVPLVADCDPKRIPLITGAVLVQ